MPGLGCYVGAPVPGEVQTITRAEILPVLQVLRNWKRFKATKIVMYIDNRSVVTMVLRLLLNPHIGAGELAIMPNHDWWAEIALENL